MTRNRREIGKESSPTNDNAHQELRLLLKSDEAAKALAISPRTLWGITKSGKIPSVRIGTAVRYDLNDLRRYIEGQKN